MQLSIGWDLSLPYCYLFSIHLLCSRFYSFFGKIEYLEIIFFSPVDFFSRIFVFCCCVWFCFVFSFFLKTIFNNIYSFLRDRDTEWEWERGRERGRHRIRRLQALSCQHRARPGAQTHPSRDHDLSQVRRLTDWTTQVPPTFLFDNGPEIYHLER